MRLKYRTIMSLCLLMIGLLVGHALADQQIVISFLGDCTLGGEDQFLDKSYSFNAVRGEEGYGYYFRNVEALLAEDDITVANLEGVLRDDRSGAVQKRNSVYNFRGDTENTKILQLGSVEVVGLENNHTMDFGMEGLADTKQALGDAGIGYFDRDDVYIYEKDGVRIAFVGLDGVSWDDYKAHGGAVVETIRSLKADETIHMVIATLHAGDEYGGFHSEAQAKKAYRLIDAGADLIIGTHPHVVQGMEVYKERLILYSLGNFVFGGNAKVRALETIIPRISLRFSDDKELLGMQLRIYPAHVAGDNAESVYDNNYQPVLVEGAQAKDVYYLLDRDSKPKTAPALDAETDQYRDYAWISITPQE